MVATGDNSVFKHGLRRSIVESFVEGFDFKSNDRYFLFVGKVDGWTGGDVIPSLTDSRSEDVDIWRNIVGIKQIDRNSIFYMIPKYEWTNGIKYTMYDDTVDLTDKKFYVLNSEYNVYKCIHNNNQLSSVEPSGIKVDGNITTSDGYVWKYMYTIPEPHRYHIDDNLIPVNIVSSNGSSTETNNQWKVQNNSINGAIEYIYIDQSTVGVNWDSALVIPHNPTVNLTSDNSLSGATGISLNSTHLQSDDDYNGLVITVTSGNGSGQRRIITDYVGGSDNMVKFDTPLTKEVPINSNYEIAPRITIYGDGVSADAYIDLYDYDADYATRKQIERIAIANKGKNYTYATVEFTPITVSASMDNGVTADARPIISPQGGHGSNAVRELDCTSLLVTVNIDQNENNDFLPENEIRQYGILKNPILNDTDSQYLDINGNPHRVAGLEASLKTTLEISPINSEAFLPETLFTIGKYIIGKESKANAKIENWSPSLNNNRGILTISKLNGNFITPVDSSATGEGIVEFEQSGDSWDFSTVQVASVSGFDNIYANTVPTYNCTWTLGISGDSLTTSSFPIDIGVTGGSATTGPQEPTGLCLNWVVDDTGTGGTLTLTEAIGIFNTGDSIGSSSYSSTTSVINNITQPEIKQNTGEIIYAQNMKPVEREQEQREQYQIILKF
jgi:hypothetical protein